MAYMKSCMNRYQYVTNSLCEWRIDNNIQTDTCLSYDPKNCSLFHIFLMISLVHLFEFIGFTNVFFTDIGQ
jgi:hypothetical protein